jgi:hypothetical protein
MAKPQNRRGFDADEVLRRPAISPEELFKLGLMPLSRAGIYDACARGEFESFRIGKKIMILTESVRRKLKLGVEAA